MKSLFFKIAFGLACGVFPMISDGQSAGNYLYNNPYALNTDRAIIPVVSANGNIVTLKAEVLMNVQATSYTAIFAISQHGGDAYEADSILNTRLTQVRFALGRLGVSEENIHVDAISMVPTYAYQLEEKKFSKYYTEVPTGIEMKKNVHILFKHHEQLDRIISEMAFVNIYDLVKVEYNIDGMNSYYEELRNAALDVIHSKEKTYDALKFYLDVQGMSDGFNCSYPAERYKNYTAYYSGASPASVSYARKSWESSPTVIVSGKNNKVNVDGSLTADARNQQFVVQTAEKNKTIFYDRMPYNQFDKVLNANTEEPCIQFYYTLQVQYSLLTEEAHRKLEDQKQLAQENAKLNKSRRQKRIEQKLIKIK